MLKKEAYKVTEGTWHVTKVRWGASASEKNI